MPAESDESLVERVAELETALAEARAMHADVVERNVKLADLNMRLVEEMEAMERSSPVPVAETVVVAGILLGLRVENVERLQVVELAGVTRAHIHLKDGRMWSSEVIVFDSNGEPVLPPDNDNHKADKARSMTRV